MGISDTGIKAIITRNRDKSLLDRGILVTDIPYMRILDIATPDTGIPDKRYARN
jgi:hypothetical protein